MRYDLNRHHAIKIERSEVIRKAVSINSGDWAINYCCHSDKATRLGKCGGTLAHLH